MLLETRHKLLKRQNFWACMILVLAVIGVYGQAGTFNFISYDDDVYVFDNPEVNSGINAHSFVWSFSFEAKENTYWHPLSWLSHMLDVELYGLNPAGHHLTNVFFHLVNTLLLFFAFRWMTGAFWPSFFLAALFAVHPINVESVAWVSERKNVLSTFFWMLTMLGYIYYTKRPHVLRYLMVVLAMAAGLLAKPVLVTLPFVFLLMDFWPLERIRISPRKDDRRDHRHLWNLIMEKVPLLVLSGMSVYLSSQSVQGMGNVVSFELAPLKLRIANALTAYVGYLAKLAWPQDMTIFYPYPKVIPLWQVAGALFILSAITFLVVAAMKKKPYLAVGWFWYLGTLMPMSGLMQAGLWPALADRWAYVPFVGLYMTIAWGVYDHLDRWRIKKIWSLVGVAATIIVFMVVARGQVRYWRNSVTLFEHALEVVGNHWLFHSSLGNEFSSQGKIDKAIHHYRLALRAPPHNPEGGYYNLASALAARGQLDEAIYYYSVALRVNPHITATRINLGDVLTKKGRTDDAIGHYLEALRIDAKSYQAYYSLGNALLAQGKTDEGIKHFLSALRVNPGFALTHNSLGLAMLRKGELGDAVRQLKLAVKLNPQNAQTQRNLNLAISLKNTIKTAIAKMLAAIQFDSEDPDLDRRLEELLVRKTNLETGLSRYKKSLSHLPGFNGIDFDNIESVYELKQEYKKKLPVFKKIAVKLPDNANACYHVACIYARQEQIPEAIHWLKIAVAKGFDRWNLLRIDSDLNSIKDSDYYLDLVNNS